MALFAEELADFIGQLGRERTFANAGRIGLGDAEDIAERARAHAGAGSGLAGDRVRRGDEGIGAVVDVEQRALRAFEQDARALAALLVEQNPDRIHEGQDAIGDRGQLFHDRLVLDLGHAEAAAQRIVMGQDTLDLAFQRVEIGQIHKANRATADLVLIGRADAAAGGADLGAAVGGGVFAHTVKLAVQRQDERGVFGDSQVLRRDFDALVLEAADLGDQRMRVDDDAVADHGLLAGAHDARGQQRQLIADAVDHQGVAGIVAALEPDDDIRPLGEPVDDLALALVSPLRTHNHDIRHFEILSIAQALCALSKPAHLYCVVFMKSTRLCGRNRLFA